MNVFLRPFAFKHPPFRKSKRFRVTTLNEIHVAERKMGQQRANCDIKTTLLCFTVMQNKNTYKLKLNCAQLQNVKTTRNRSSSVRLEYTGYRRGQPHIYLPRSFVYTTSVKPKGHHSFYYTHENV